MSIRSLERRLARLDGGIHARDLSQLTDAQLHTVIMRGLRKNDPALAARYAAASADERDVIHEMITKLDDRS